MNTHAMTQHLIMFNFIACHYLCEDTRHCSISFASPMNVSFMNISVILFPNFTLFKSIENFLFIYYILSISL